MEQDIIVSKAFGFPGRIKRVLRDGFTVYTDINMLFFLRIAGLNIAGQPAFDAAAFVIVGSGALLAVDEKLAHVIADAVEVFN